MLKDPSFNGKSDSPWPDSCTYCHRPQRSWVHRWLSQRPGLWHPWAAPLCQWWGQSPASSADWTSVASVCWEYYALFGKAPVKNISEYITECLSRQQSISSSISRESNEVINDSIIAGFHNILYVDYFAVQRPSEMCIWFRTEWKCRRTWVFWESGSSMALSRFNPGFQAFSVVLSCTSSFTDTFVMILRPGGRRRPTFSSWRNRHNHIVWTGKVYLRQCQLKCFYSWVKHNKM